MNEERLLNEFLALVQIDSETKHEEEIAVVLTEKLTALGFDVVEDDSAVRSGHGGGNLIATMKGNVEDADRIYFTCHMDTVVTGIGIKPEVSEDCYVYSHATTKLGATSTAG